jgi:hypothetical protein
MPDNGPSDENDKPFEEEKFEEPDISDDEETERPELDIPLNDRKLLTQPFDFIVGSIEQQIKDGALVLQDEFQRRRVWDDRKSSRLIESLLLNVPVPVCYFAELEDGSYSVIDGQQRLTAIYRYLSNLLPLSGLRVRPELNRKRFAQLERVDQRMIRTRTIRCIVIQKESHPAIRFDVFERINSGAVRLKPQELRNSTYRGRLNRLLKELCEHPGFQRIRGVTEVDKRMGDAELVLRFFAFHYRSQIYRGYFAPFLDEYMKDGVNIPENQISEHRQVFKETVRKVARVFGADAFRQIGADGKSGNQVNRAIYDVVMLTFARLPEPDLGQRAREIRAQLQALCREPAFQDAIGRATRDKQRIDTRLKMWIAALQEIGLSCPPIPIGE